jgi:uncharacterized membrane protein YiaA
LTAPNNGRNRQGMTVPALSPYRLSFLLAVPLAWAVLLMFHPAPDPSDIYGSLRDESTQWLVVHIGTLLFIGLMGAALFLLVSGLPGLAAKVSRVAAGAFVLCYGAAEAILGIAAGVLVRYANVAPENERAGVAAAIQRLWDDMISADLAATVGAVSWAVGIIGAAVALRQAGAPLAVSLLLAVSTLALLHGPPIGPVGLVFFAAAVALLARSAKNTMTPATETG